MGNRNTSGLKVEENTDIQNKSEEETTRLDDVKEQNVRNPTVEDGKDLKKIENGNSNEKVKEKSLQETEKTVFSHVKGDNMKDSEAGNENAQVSAELENMKDSEAEKQNQRNKEEDSSKDESVEQSCQETAQENDAETKNHVIYVEKETEETGGDDPGDIEESRNDREKHKEKEEERVVSEQSLQETSEKDDAIGANHEIFSEDQEKAYNNPRPESLDAEVAQNGEPIEESKHDEENAASSELAITEHDSEKHEKECRIKEAQMTENEVSEEENIKEALLFRNHALIPAAEDHTRQEEPKEKKISEETEEKPSDPTSIIQAPMQKPSSFNLEESKQFGLQFKDKATIETLPNQANGEKLQDCPKNEAVPVEKVVTFLVSSKGAEEQEEARNIVTPKKEENHYDAKKKVSVSVREVSEKRKPRPPLFFGSCMSCATATN